MSDDSRSVVIDRLRSKHRKQRREITEDTLQENSAGLEQNVAALAEFQSAVHIAAYIAILGEISVEPLIRAGSEAGKLFYLPILRDESMVFAPWQPDTPLLKKKFGLLEPDCDQSDFVRPEELDLVLTPLVVFDKQCNRIGQGGGYYDRTFEFTRAADKPVLIGVAHDSQLEKTLTPQPWDIPLHKVVTESNVYVNPALPVS